MRGKATGKEFIALITAMMISSSFSVDIMLPAFPRIRRAFDMAPGSTDVRWLITAYLLGIATGPWIFGPASDRFGRKRPMLAGMALAVVGSVLATVAPSWTMLVIARFVWGVGTSVTRVISTAIIRDLYEGSAMARLMSLTLSVFLLGPIVAPTIGAGLIAVLPWRVVFWVPGILHVVVWLWTWLRLEETLAPELRRPLNFRLFGTAAKEMVQHRRTLRFTLAILVLYAMVPTYLAGSEVIIEDVYHRGSLFPFLFAAIALSMAINAMNNARLVERLSVEVLLRRICWGATAAGIALVVLVNVTDGRPNMWLLYVGFALLVPLGQGLMPNCNAAALTPLPHIAGSASAIIASVTTAGGALLAGVATDSFDGTARPISTWMAIFVFVAVAFVVWGLRATDD